MPRRRRKRGGIAGFPRTAGVDSALAPGASRARRQQRFGAPHVARLAGAAGALDESWRQGQCRRFAPGCARQAASSGAAIRRAMTAPIGDDETGIRGHETIGRRRDRVGRGGYRQQRREGRAGPPITLLLIKVAKVAGSSASCAKVKPFTVVGTSVSALAKVESGRFAHRRGARIHRRRGTCAWWPRPAPSVTVTVSRRAGGGLERRQRDAAHRARAADRDSVGRKHAGRRWPRRSPSGWRPRSRRR